MTIKQKILNLKNKGFSYYQIIDKLKIRRSLIYYYFYDYRTNNPQKLTWKIRFSDKIRRFHRAKNKKNKQISKKSWKIKFRSKILWFLINNRKERITMKNFSSKEALEKFGDNPKCYLTGRSIDLTKTDTYHFDHIIPKSKGGQNTLENLGLACAEANKAKSDKDPQEFIELCKEVLIHNGYTIQ